MSSPIVLEVRGVSKEFPGVRALSGVDLTLAAGSLTALLGENGAGKSTLMNIVAGVLKADRGTVRLNGNLVEFSNAKEALDAGIAMIHQELYLFEELTVAQNIFLGKEPRTKLGFIDEGAMNRQAAALLGTFDLPLDPSTPLKTLRVGQRQMVEIAKAISCEAKVIIMDEPTSALTTREVETLFAAVRKLKNDGVAIAYITHKMEELTEIGDNAVVLRDGCLVGEGSLKDLSRDEIITMMVGREGGRYPVREVRKPGREVLRLQDVALSKAGNQTGFVLRDINLTLQQGEVLGVFGLMGAGRTELLECIFGLHHGNVSGHVYVGGEPESIRSPKEAIACGIALAPEDRKKEGLILGMSVLENATLASLPSHERHGLLSVRSQNELVSKIIDDFSVKTPSAKQTIRNLSGGNQQKVILGKWLATNPSILLLDEPTRGIDVRAKAEIYQLINELSKQGLSVIVVSSELPEILAISDRIAVMCEGTITGSFTREEATEERIMNAALPKLEASA